MARLEGPEPLKTPEIPVALATPKSPPKPVETPPPLRRPEPVRPEVPRPPAPPSPSNPVILAVQRFFTGGNLVVRIGVIVLFFGVSFLLKLAIDHGLIPIEVRLAGVAVAAMVLMVAGWRLREKRAGYAY